MGLTADFTKTYPDGPAIQARLRIPLDAFSLTVLFGPSGCGKTTVLRCLAGLERPDRGRIDVDGQAWHDDHGGSGTPPASRRVGYVVQEPALFPHLSVAANIGYGVAGAGKAARVAELVELTGLQGLEGRRPRELSGGQKQRVALARALAPRPRLLLLDEPFASLDRAAAVQLRHKLRQVLEAQRVPAVLVTHDPLEALALGDRLVLMAEGRITREGHPAEVLGQPGQPGAEAMGAVARVRVAGRIEGLLRLAAGSAELYAPDPGGEFTEAYACIRAEGVALERGPHGAMTQRNRLPAMIQGVEALGALTRVRLDAGFPLEALITTWAAGDLGLGPGQPVTALVKASAIQVIPIEP